MVEGVVDDVLKGVRVLLLGLDHDRVKAAAEDVIAAAVAVVEGARIGPVEIAHAVREVGGGRFDDEVVVVAQKAARMDAPAIAADDPPEDLEEDRTVPVVVEDRRPAIAACRDVVVSARGEVTRRSAHPGDRSAAGAGKPLCVAFWRCSARNSLRARQETRPDGRVRRRRPQARV
jgi:hypothetical protein